MMRPASLTTIVFDYGNTLVPFGPATVDAINGALAATLTRHYGRVDRTALDAIRAEDRVRPYQRDYRENDLVELSVNLVRRLYGWEPTRQVVDDLLEARRSAFLSTVTLPDGVLAILTDLGRRYALGLLSNYPDGDVLRESMVATGISHLFSAVVVSGDVGYCKPHPKPFEALASRLRSRPSAAILVGDNWLADVQGAKRFGMSAALLTEYVPIERFEPQPGDAQPDVVLERFEEVADYF